MADDPSVLYIDTNVYSEVVRNVDIRVRLCSLAADKTALIGLSTSNIIELEPVRRMHKELVQLLLQLPTVLLKPEDVVLEEEVDSYPSARQDPLYDALFYDPTADPEKHILTHMFSDPRVVSGARLHRENAAKAPARNNELQENFPVAASGRYERSQVASFAEQNAFQRLVGAHTDFVRRELDDGPMSMMPFKSLRMFAYLLFWRFYLNRRTPNPSSDLGDLAHAQFYPYCRVVVTENDAAETLRQIKKHSDLLDGVEIMTLRDLRRYESP